MTRVLLLLALLPACVPPTHNAILRREAAYRLESCWGLKWETRQVRRSDFQHLRCVRQTREWCLSQGLELTCGEDT